MQFLVVGLQHFLIRLKVAHRLHQAYHLLQRVNVGGFGVALVELEVGGGTDGGAVRYEAGASGGPFGVGHIVKLADQNAVHLFAVDFDDALLVDFEVSTVDFDGAFVSHHQ